MRLVIVESPFKGKSPEDELENLLYARAAMFDCLRRGEAPFASHALYTQPGVLNDADPDDRAFGIAAGLAWGEKADATVVYNDRGVSQGMAAGIQAAHKCGRPVEVRSIPFWRLRGYKQEGAGSSAPSSVLGAG